MTSTYVRVMSRLGKHAGLFKVFHALRQETFANAKARKLFALKKQNSQTPAAEQRRRQRAGRSGADNQYVHDHIVCFDFSAAIAAKFSANRAATPLNLLCENRVR